MALFFTLLFWRSFFRSVVFGFVCGELLFFGVVSRRGLDEGYFLKSPLIDITSFNFKSL